MCGIAGYIGNRQLDEAKVKDALKVMHHRGPDYAAYKHWQNPAGRQVYLLHTRLSIIDLDPRAHQPFHYQGRWMAYNGELYNYLELKAELAKRGEPFSTSSDTEVMIHQLVNQNWKGLDDCEGMWAFALYDERNGSLLLGRDRFGEKPLYLFQDDSGIYFGSEVTAITALLGRKLEINQDHLHRYLVNGYKSLYKKPCTFFKGLTELPAASVLSIDGSGRTESHVYWKPHYEPDESMSYEDAVAQAKDRLIQSVQLRLRADVPLAFCMSGGVDSSSLISIAKKIFDYDVHGFTIVNTDSRYEEQDMVDCLVRELKLRHTSIPVHTTDFLAKLRQLIHIHQAPVYTITYYAQWLLMESIAQHGYRISISGTGADELFTGYYDHHLAYLYEIRREPALYAASREAWSQHIKPLVRNPYLSNPDLFIENPSERSHIYFNADNFATYLKNEWQEPFVEERFTESLLRRRMLNEMFHEAVPAILHEDDLNAMSYSIENRSPYLDRSLFEFCFSIPSRHLIQDGRAKAILRDAMKGIVPEAIRANRRKVGFNAPIFSFLDVEDSQTRSYLLDQSPIFDYVHRDKVEKLLQKETLPNSESKFIFYFLSSKMFLEEVSS